MARLKNHPELWLRDDAAAEFDRAEDDHGVFVVNSAGRTEAEQQELITRWDKGGTFNRPPYLYPPARPAKDSNHVRNGGVAADLGDWQRFARVCRAYGFVHTYPGGDPVHFDFVGGNLGRGGYVDGSPELIAFQEKLIAMGHDLGPTGADGKFGSRTKAATLHEQQWAEKNKYPGGIVVDDGFPGPRTDAYLDWWLTGRHQAPKPAPKPTPNYNPFGISSARGLQKVAKLYGYKGSDDDIWGKGSAAGFAEFLRRNWGYKGNDTLGPVMWSAIARWLRARYKYVGNDTPGPVMRAALERANKANFEQLK